MSPESHNMSGPFLGRFTTLVPFGENERET